MKHLIVNTWLNRKRKKKHNIKEASKINFEVMMENHVKEKKKNIMYCIIVLRKH